ncbi:MAG TPA: hypothetical protein VGK26_00070 [Thermoanaerobaculia bacterium]
MPDDSRASAKRLRMQTVRALWPLLLLLLLFAWRSTACKKKEEQPAGAGKKGARPHITYHYPTPQPTYTFRPGITPNILAE